MCVSVYTLAHAEHLRTVTQLKWAWVTLISGDGRQEASSAAAARGRHQSQTPSSFKKVFSNEKVLYSRDNMHNFHYFVFSYNHDTFLP